MGLSLLATPAFSQATSTSTVSGQVLDQQSAAIPDTVVTLTDQSTNQVLTAATNQAGRYLFVNVPSGTYSVSFQKQGFNTYKVAEQKVEVGSAVTVNATLEVGSTATTIEVVGVAGAELQTTNATVGATISGASVLLLPNLGRDVSTLAVLQPAVTSSGFTAGAYNDSNTYTLDGGNITDDMAGNTIGYQTNFTGTGGTQTGGYSSGVIPTPVESVEEVRVSVFGQGADFNNSTGANVQMATKRGTNGLHGSAYGYYFATNVGAANSWANNHTPSNFGGVKRPFTPLPSNHRDRFGASLGGPFGHKEFLGGRWYGFVNYEGLRFPNVGTYERAVPTNTLRAGVIEVPDTKGVYQPYNLNPYPVTVDGQLYEPAQCPAGACDPRGIGMSPIIRQLWTKYMPVVNDLNGAGDQENTGGYLSTIRAPLTTNNYIGRIDHDFSSKWRWMGSYRYQRLINVTTNQVDIGGALPGDTLGQPAAKAPRPQVDGYFVTALTTNITPTTINDFRFAYLRQFWQWGTAQAPPQLPGLGGALELLASGTSTTGESSSALIPYNINSQNIRQRFWDGQNKQLADNINMIKGNHLFQFGGSYQRNYDYHMRTDNGIGINNQVVYWVGNFGSSIGMDFPSSLIPTAVPSGGPTNQYRNWYAAVLGIVSQTQVAYTRAGSALNLQPLGSVAFDQSIIPYYNVYFSDTWHLKPTLTFTYGLAYALEMPPYEVNGKQVELVDSADNLVTYKDYIAQRKKAALAGEVYNPILAATLVRNVGKGLKYPYNPFYGEFSPRASLAWNPSFDSGLLGKLFGNRNSVLRLGYGRIYGRINGVNQVLVPLLGPGLLQPVICNGATSSGQCLGGGMATPSNAFRIGPDGLTAPLPSASPTLAQPFFPGGATANAGDSTFLDPDYRPNRTDNFTLSFQRQLSPKITLEAGYIGRISRDDFMEINLDAVPYMTTLGGQTFAQAYANVRGALCPGYAYPTLCASTANLAPQPFFEAALGGPNSAYCKNFSSCTAAVIANQASNIKNALVSSFWAALNSAPSWTLGRTMISSPLNGGANQANSMTLVGSYGWSNYNALYVSLRTNGWHGITAASHFTWGRALGTAELAQYNSSSTPWDPYNLDANYGLQNFDYKFVYNLSMYYQPSFFKNLRGWKGHLLDGWTISPLFTAQSGAPYAITYTPSQSQAFGESSSASVYVEGYDNAVGAARYTGGSSAHYGITGSTGIGTNNPYGVNMFSDPAAVYAEFRPCTLGVDVNCGGYANLRGLPRWNLDATVAKDFRLAGERVGATLLFQFTNVMNHVVMSNPATELTNPSTFGRITSQANTPRNMEFGLRIHF